MRPGPTNSLADVAGLRVGHAHRIGGGYRTGTTVVLAPDEGAVAGVDVRGAAPGTRETELLDPRNLVERVHAVVLSGGSAFGLGAACGVMDRLADAGIGYPVANGAVPIVPAAVIFDLARGGTFRATPDAAFGTTAYEAARTPAPSPTPARTAPAPPSPGTAPFPSEETPPPNGGKGTSPSSSSTPLLFEGTSAQDGGGGASSSSRSAPFPPDGTSAPDGGGGVPLSPGGPRFSPEGTSAPDGGGGVGSARGVAASEGFVTAGATACGSVGAGAGAVAGGLAGGVGTASVVLPSGVTVAALAVANPAGSVLDPHDATLAGIRYGLPGEFDHLRPPTPEEARAWDPEKGPSFNTTIGVVATDLTLTKAQCGKLAAVAHDGLARAIRPAHTMTDGDTVFGLGTCTRPAPDQETFQDVLAAAADVFSRAVAHAVLAATGREGAPAYLDVFPSALRKDALRKET
ncbi:Peptidase family S58 [Nonomuraea maritima]|uniref:Peptidase family S58 n=1 Tax=Nonomuraea maritima TaxID=683260 RepID=A0A1G8WVU5_9ACTN|nr:P1 family peptidase [Nonomuraea maritima]SDJ82187.1 Peptidase family S58 [Nonomuraea maritima]